MKRMKKSEKKGKFNISANSENIKELIEETEEAGHNSGIECVPQEKPLFYKTELCTKKIILMQRTYLGETEKNIETISNFFDAIIQTEIFPAHILLIREAVKLASIYESTISKLKILEKFKVNILVEKEALYEFELSHKCCAGIPSAYTDIIMVIMSNRNILCV